MSRQAFVVTGGRAFRLNVLNVGLACCAVEAMVASLGSQAVPGAVPLACCAVEALVAAVADGGGDLVPTDSPVDVVVVSGTVTDKLAPLVRRLYDDLPGPVKVVAYGACASSGGPYWDSYCVTKGVDQIIPVDVYVPGCPPRPEALIEGFLKLQEKIRTEHPLLGNKEPVASADDRPDSDPGSLPA